MTPMTPLTLTMTRWLLLLAIPCLVAVPVAAQDAGGAATFALVGGRVLMPDGSLADGLAVVISGDRITHVMRADTARLSNVRRVAAGAIQLGSCDMSHLAIIHNSFES